MGMHGRIPATLAAMLAAVCCGLPGVAGAAIETRTYSTDTQPAVAGYPNQGQWSTAYGHATAFGANYAVGRQGQNEYRNFFGFYRSQTDTCIADRITLAVARYFDEGTGTVQYRASAVDTDMAALMAFGPFNATIFHDLGSGTAYGQQTIQLGEVVYPGFGKPLPPRYLESVAMLLNDDAVNAFNATRDGYFRLGGKLTDTNGNPLSGDGSRFAYSDSGGVQELIVTCNSTPVASISGDTAVDEGQDRTYTAVASDEDNDALSYEWDVVGAGAEVVGSSTGSTVRLHFPDGPAAPQLKLTVTDEDGASTTATRTLTANNVAPTVSSVSLSGTAATACQTGNDVGLTYQVTDPGDDTTTVLVDWGDGSGPDDQASHRYQPGGPYTVSVRATDSDGATGAGAHPASGAFKLAYQLTAFLPPINSDGSSVYKRKAGSTIPVKIRALDCAGGNVPSVALRIGTSKTAGLSETDAINETPSTSTADTTGFMRNAGDHYMYNLATEYLDLGQHTIYVRGPQVLQRSVSVGLR